MSDIDKVKLLEECRLFEQLSVDDAVEVLHVSDYDNQAFLLANLNLRAIVHRSTLDMCLVAIATFQEYEDILLPQLTRAAADGSELAHTCLLMRKALRL